jgi:hypothetical protein
VVVLRVPQDGAAAPLALSAAIHPGTEHASPDTVHPVTTAPEMQPWNIYLRLGVELLALGGIWAGTFAGSTSWLRWMLAVGGPLAAATIWDIFNVPGDPSRSARPRIPVPGLVRLFIEFAILSLGLWGWVSSGRIDYTIIFSVAVVVHYAASRPRLEWLAAQRRTGR